MPIKPENAKRYPPNWKEIRAAVLERAGNRCEGSPAYPECRVPNGWWRWEDGRLRKWQDPYHASVRIVLTIGHLNHTPEDVRMENLKCWCQRCHLTYDAAHHAQSAYATRRKGKAIADLLE